MVYNCKVFCYANNKQQIRFYSNDIHVNDCITEMIQEKRSITKSVKKDNNIESDKEFSALVSQKRTINEIYNITRSNSWDYFITLTFNPQRVNRYDFDTVVEAAGKYFNFHKPVRLILPLQEVIIRNRKIRRKRKNLHK